MRVNITLQPDFATRPGGVEAIVERLEAAGADVVRNRLIKLGVVTADVDESLLDRLSSIDGVRNVSANEQRHALRPPSEPPARRGK